jgi:phospholipase C
VALQDIEHIVFCMLENRSFDHMLGYLSLSTTPGQKAPDGLKQDAGWLHSYTNLADGKPYALKWLNPVQVVDDPPHDLKSIDHQVKTPAAERPQMGGFVQAYVDKQRQPDAQGRPKPPLKDAGAVMGYYDKVAVPSFDFFATHYCICDRWFAALPLGTQPNRLMAMAGESKLDENKGGFPIPYQKLVYEWLHEHGIRWCVYQKGSFLPFFTLMKQWIGQIVGDLTLSEFGIKTHFRRFHRFRHDWMTADQVPQVIFVEPEYGDGPHIEPCDDHPPTGVARGQALLHDLYDALISNPARWAKALLVVTYDEHGGFFDHVPPFDVDDVAGGMPFTTTGIRVPALLVSPHVEAGGVFSDVVDHTSFLQLLADRFTPGADYSPAVQRRQAQIPGRLKNALLPSARSDPPPTFALPSETKSLATALTATPHPAAAPGTANSLALDAAAREAFSFNPELLDHAAWSGLKAYLEAHPVPPQASEHDQIV